MAGRISSRSIRWWLARPGRRRAVRRTPIASTREEMLADPALPPGSARLLAAVDLRIHPDDAMFRGDTAHYLGAGLSAIDCIDEALVRTGATAAGERDRAGGGEVLDFACGYGRVLRFLVARFPASRFVACEVQRRALRFCAHRFGAAPVRVPRDPSRIDLDRQFDLIWCGSLLPHLDETGARAVLRVFAGALRSTGVAVVTTQGAGVAERPGETFAGLEPAAAGSIVAAFGERGYGYAPYPGESDYGVALCSVEWMREAAAGEGLRVEWHSERGWAGHQDAFALVPTRSI